MSSINGGVQGLKINLINSTDDKNEKITVDSLDLNFIFECLLSEDLNDILKAKKYLDSKNITFLFEEYGENGTSFFTNNGQVIFNKHDDNKYLCTGEFYKYKNVNISIVQEKIKKLKESVNFYCNFTKNFWID